ncbi:hypothetical protein [Myxococcus virescens]|uniref:Uncharacterized protein n=1 Tax=Myxococcus virescens TaxID=83456 RepID=A0A511H723_9BACT|nr:hypothetical protein [Myxococcus virescens]GEL69332.1 hypothetical protein MVI01_11160 [Myxococcus virescens]SDE36445.1 hypothetical protein SAMN04488504_106181 [Myxococcus virescens]
MRFSPLSGSASSAVRSPAQDAFRLPAFRVAVGSLGASARKPSLGRIGMQQAGFDLGGNLPPALESAAAKTGVPVEMLAAQVSAESRGVPTSRAARPPGARKAALPMLRRQCRE